MSVINTQIKPFKTQAFKNGKFIEVTEKDVLGKWAVFFFYPADFTFVCPTELGDVADHYDELQKLGVEVFSVSTRSEEHTSELQSQSNLVCRLLLEKKKNNTNVPQMRMLPSRSKGLLGGQLPRYAEW